VLGAITLLNRLGVRRGLARTPRHRKPLGLGDLGLASIIMPAALFSLAMSAALQADVR